MDRKVCSAAMIAYKFTPQIKKSCHTSARFRFNPVLYPAGVITEQTLQTYHTSVQRQEKDIAHATAASTLVLQILHGRLLTHSEQSNISSQLTSHGSRTELQKQRYTAVHECSYLILFAQLHVRSILTMHGCSRYVLSYWTNVQTFTQPRLCSSLRSYSCRAM